MIGDDLADRHTVCHHGHDRRDRHPQATDGRLATHNIWVGRDPAECPASMVLTRAAGRRSPQFPAKLHHDVAAPGPSSIVGPLFSVSATSPANAWAVGADFASTSHGDLILHWNGTAWSVVFRPTPAGPSFLGVTAASAASAWAVGFYTTSSGQPRTLIMHWNGTSWSPS